MKLPVEPGVYIMKDKNGGVIYIGKAKALKHRVSQYFGTQSNFNEKTVKMVSHVEDFEYILCDSEYEALVLESSLIKQHQPKYNILLKDDKGHHYIKISQGPYRKISAVNQINNDGATYLGPYISGFIVRQTVELANKTFKLPDCGKEFPRDSGKGRACFYHSIGQCMAPCKYKIEQSEYDEAVGEAVNFIKGGSDSAIAAYTEKMERSAEQMNYEQAAKYRDMIKAIKYTLGKQKIVHSGVENQDVIAIAQIDGKICFEIFRFDGGRLYDREHFIEQDVKDAAEARSEFIGRYYGMREQIPAQITLDGEVSGEPLLKRWLFEKSGKKATFSYPQKGGQAQLVSMCRSNAFEHLAHTVGKTGRETAAVKELEQLLSLKNPPEYIEAYDISHTSGSETVGAMVVFSDGRPYKAGYRRFSIKDSQAHDDYAAMSEVLSRRFDRYESEKETGEGFGRLPDLILLDGGKGHVGAIAPVLAERGLDIPVFGMVKDEKHRTRAIAVTGGEISITSTRKAYTLISNIQNEVHRFAIGYHRTAHKKKTFAGGLTDISGVGENKAKILLKHFRTVQGIKNATEGEIALVKGIDRKTAQNVYCYFRQTVDKQSQKMT